MKLKKLKLKKYWQLYLLLLPTMVYVLIFCYEPMYGIIIAFKDYKVSRGYLGSEWVGLKHFVRFLTYPDLWKMIRNTLAISLYTLALFPVPIILALLINEIRNIHFKKTVQMVTYAPYFLSTVVVCGMIVLLVGKEGPIGMLYMFLTGESRNLLTISRYFSSIYVLSGLWQTAGWSTILYLSALAGVPQELVESAQIDGATRVQVIRHINVPCIMSTIIITFIMSTGSILSVGFEKIFLLQNDLNLDASNVIATYTYDIGLVGGQFSYSTAIGLFNSLVNIAVLIFVNKVTKRISGVGIW